MPPEIPTYDANPPFRYDTPGLRYADSLVQQLVNQKKGRKGMIVKLDLKGKTIPQIVELMRNFAQGLTDNATLFTNPDPTPAQLNAGADALEGKYNAADTKRKQSVIATSEQNASLDDATRLLNNGAAYVDKKANGNPDVVHKANLEVRGEATPSGDLPAPEGVSASTGDLAGTADVGCHSMRSLGAMSYVYQRSQNPTDAATWMQVKISTKSQETLDGMTSGQHYWFRMAAIGPNGQSPWSGDASCNAG